MKIVHIPLNIPNILSLFRLFSFPFVLIFVFQEMENFFVFFICFHFLTDILDGWIARKFNQRTEIGATIDSLADTGTYILAILGVWVFKRSDFEPHLFLLIVFLVLLLLADLYPTVKFGQFNNYHTYAAKVGGYVKGSFFVVLFTLGFNVWFFYFTLGTGILALLESLIITFLLNESRSDVKGLYWMLKRKV